MKRNIIEGKQGMRAGTGSGKAKGERKRGGIKSP